MSVSVTYATDDSVAVNVASINYQYQDWGQYPSVNLSSKNYVPLTNDTNSIWQSDVSKLAELILDSSDVYSLKIGETLTFGQGYTLGVLRVDNSSNKVRLILSHNGIYEGDGIVGTATSDDHNWTLYITGGDLIGKNYIPVFKAHVKDAFKDENNSVVQIDGLWLIDFSNAEQLYVGKQLGSYTLKAINRGADASNLGSLVFVYNSSLPVAAFYASSTYGNEPLNISFTDTSTGNPTSWYWDFGDGNTASNQNPTHTYVEAGDYTVNLTVKNAYGVNTNSSVITVANEQDQTEPTPTEQPQPETTNETNSSTSTAQNGIPWYQNSLIQSTAAAVVSGLLLYIIMGRKPRQP